MASNKEIKEHLSEALKEIGPITPWFDKEVNEWVFSHSDYPVEYGGDSQEEVIQNYPKYLQEFIQHRLDGNLSPLVEKRTKGHGGRREGAGRPTGTAKEVKQRISLPIDVAIWLKNNPQAIKLTRQIMRRHEI